MGRMRYMKEDAGSLGMHTIWNTTGNEGMGYRDGIERYVNGHKGRPGSGYGREPVVRTLRRLGGDSDRLSGHEYDQHHSNRKSTGNHSTYRAIIPFHSHQYLQFVNFTTTSLTSTAHQVCRDQRPRHRQYGHRSCPVRQQASPSCRNPSLPRHTSRTNPSCSRPRYA